MRSALLSLFLFALGQPGPNLETPIPPDFPIRISVKKTVPHPLKEFRSQKIFFVEMTNDSSSSIVAFAFKSACFPPFDNRFEFAPGQAEYFFYPQSSQAPIAPGETRDLFVTVHQQSPQDTRCLLLPLSILFDDGTSRGAREPYAQNYLSELEAWIADHRGPDGKASNPEEQELYHVASDTAYAIRMESHRLQMEELKKRVTSPHR